MNRQTRGFAEVERTIRLLGLVLAILAGLVMATLAICVYLLTQLP
jgi:hypothetical protein